MKIELAKLGPGHATKLDLLESMPVGRLDNRLELLAALGGNLHRHCEKATAPAGSRRDGPLEQVPDVSTHDCDDEPFELVAGVADRLDRDLGRIGERIF